MTGPEDVPSVLTRQPAYDAVYAYIRELDSYMPADVVHRNALMWRAVTAALDALGVPLANAPESHGEPVEPSDVQSHQPGAVEPSGEAMASGRCHSSEPHDAHWWVATRGSVWFDCPGREGP